MSLTPTPSWDDVPQWDTATPLLGGPASAPLNRQAQALANRTALLKSRTDAMVLPFATQLDAVNALAGLAEGQRIEIDADETRGGHKTRYVVSGGLLVFKGRFEDFTVKAAQPEYFGATGLDADADTAAFKAMFAAASEGKFNCYQPDPAKTYLINEPLDPGPVSQWLTDLNIEVRANDIGQHIPLLKTEGIHSFENIKVHVPAGFSYRGILRNDFYNDSNKPLSTRKVRIGDLEITSIDVITGYTGDGASAVMFGYCHSLTIGNIIMDGFDRSLNVTDGENVTLGRRNIKRSKRPLQYTRFNNLSDEGGTSHGDGSYGMGAGANGMVIRGSINGKMGPVDIYDSDEHGIRATAEEIPGVPWDFVGGNLSIGQVRVIRPGGCAIKLASGSGDGEPEETIVNIDIASVYYEDAGRSVYKDPVTEPPAGGNHFGISSQNVKGLRIGKLVGKKVLNSYNGTHAVMARRAQDVHIGFASISDTYDAAYFFNNSTTSEDFSIYDGDVINCGNGAGTQAITILNPSNVNRLFINSRFQSCPAIVGFGSTGTPAGPIIIRGDRFNVPTVIKGSAPSSRLIVDVREIGWPNSSGLEFPIGTTLFCLGGGSVPARNSGVGVYLSATSTQRFIATNTDAGSSGDTLGAKLQGTWVVVGAMAGAAQTLVRRIA